MVRERVCSFCFLIFLLTYLDGRAVRAQEKEQKFLRSPVPSSNKQFRKNQKKKSREKYPRIYKVSCIQNRKGCPCPLSPPSGSHPSRSKGNKNRNPSSSYSLHHAQSVVFTGHKAKSLYQIQVGGDPQKTCWYPKDRLILMNYAKVLHSRFQKLSHIPIPLSQMIGKVKLDHKKRIRLGYFWPTYYHLALEDFHPGHPVPVLDTLGKVLTKASLDFQKKVRWQGSGISKRGIRLSYVFSKNPLRFRTYPSSIWGFAAARGYQIYPYRTIAVNFSGLCAAFRQGKGCTKAQVAGALVYIRDLDERRIKMPSGKNHDGFFCASDTGSPYYIRHDRIDIFVGTHRGGNPYLPPERRPNYLIRGGLENLVPADWRLWKGKNQRVWCPRNKIPVNPKRPQKGDCTHDYHVAASHKSLRLYGFLETNGRIMKCRRNSIR